MDLQERARQIRLDTLKTIFKVGSGHPGGALSIAELLAVLYFDEMNIRPEEPGWADRDRFILSKGHASTALYAVLAERGYYPVEELATMRQYGSRLQGHPDMELTPGVDMSSGSLGQGLSIGSGMALAAKLQKKDWRVYVLLGDGECEEGQVWEAAMTAPRRQLDNLVAIVDVNGLQINGRTDNVSTLEPLEDKFRDFGWHVLSIDGHDIPSIRQAFRQSREHKGQPTAIIAHTVKGKGVSFMENSAAWHSGHPNEEQYRKALQELGGEA